jgi:hypothetical protein
MDLLRISAATESTAVIAETAALNTAMGRPTQEERLI